jgi:hypothetical protein
MEEKLKTWKTPELITHGSLEKITQQTKNKTFGNGDDVLVNNQQILTNVS